MTDMYESFKSVYFPTNAIETRSKRRSWLQKERIISFSMPKCRDLLSGESLPSALQGRAVFEHIRHDVETGEIKPTLEETHNALGLEQQGNVVH